MADYVVDFWGDHRGSGDLYVFYPGIPGVAPDCLGRYRDISGLFNDACVPRAGKI